MEIIETLDTVTKPSLIKSFENSHDLEAIKDTLGKTHVFRVHIYDHDFDRILINSTTTSKDLPQSDYPTLGSVIKTITPESDFFNSIHTNRGLSGTTARKYVDEFRNGKLWHEAFFLVDRDFYPAMNQNGLFYVRDGMHHLVAYGVATQMSQKAFPITGYYGSNHETP